MIFRQFIAVMLGALLQVSLLGIGTASLAPAGSDCAPSACCCSGETSCPCVKSGESEKPAPPALPASQEHINPVVVPTDLGIPGFLKSTDPSGKCQPLPWRDDFHGYRGVALHVSFCRFTI
jgi:hypothetical protein